MVNELPKSGQPSDHFADKSVRSLITEEQYWALVNRLNYYNYHTSSICKDRIAAPWFFYNNCCSWDDYSSDDHYYMIFDLEVETRVTVHEGKDDEVQDYIKVTAEDMKRFLKEMKDKEEKNIEELEKGFTKYFGI